MVLSRQQPNLWGNEQKYKIKLFSIEHIRQMNLPLNFWLSHNHNIIDSLRGEVIGHRGSRQESMTAGSMVSVGKGFGNSA